MEINRIMYHNNIELDSCIVWNAHNTVFVSKRSAICAQAVYFLHSTRFSVTWLNSRWWLAACDWVMSALSAMLSTRVWLRRKLREVSCTKCIGQGNGFELIPTVEIVTRNPVEGYLGSEFPAICSHCGCLMSQGVVFKFREIWPTGNRWNRALFAWQKKTKIRLALQLSLLLGSRPKFARASPRQYTQSARDLIQIGSLSADQ